MKIFFSYSRSDYDIARFLAGRLKEAGYEVWVDFEGIPGGSNWTDEIQRAIENMDAMIVLVSPESNASRWVQSETLFAIQTNKPIYPVLVRDAELPLYLIHIQYLDLRDKNPAAIDSLVRALQSRQVPEIKLDQAPSASQIQEQIQELEENAPTIRVFIAYAREQRPTAKKLAAMLRNNGFSVFYDAHIRAGARWRRAIQAALDDATHMVLIWTSDAAASDEVEREITYALGERIFIVPLLSPDIPKLPYHLYGLQYLVFGR